MATFFSSLISSCTLTATEFKYVTLAIYNLKLYAFWKVSGFFLMPSTCWSSTIYRCFDYSLKIIFSYLFLWILHDENQVEMQKVYSRVVDNGTKKNLLH